MAGWPLTYVSARAFWLRLPHTARHHFQQAGICSLLLLLLTACANSVAAPPASVMRTASAASLSILRYALVVDDAARVSRFRIQSTDITMNPNTRMRVRNSIKVLRVLKVRNA